MNRYRIEFTQHDNGVPVRFAITFQSESKETAKAVLSYRHPLAWDVVIKEVERSEYEMRHNLLPHLEA